MKKTQMIRITVVIFIICLMVIGAIPSAFAYANSEFLDNISVTNAKLSRNFHSNTYEYQLITDIGYSSSTISVTPDDPAATVTINGMPEKTITLSLSEGNVHQATILVVSADGLKSKTYKINLIPRPNNADLSSINGYSSTLSPYFSPDILNYTLAPAQHSTFYSISVQLADPFATVKINGQDSDSVRLAFNDPSYAKTAVIEVTAADLVTKKTYTVTMTDSNADLIGMGVGMVFGGKLSPDFKPDTTFYYAKPVYEHGYIDLSLNPSDWRSSIKVNGNSLWKSNGVYSIRLGDVGNSMQSAIIEVTAPDGETKKTYTVEYLASDLFPDWPSPKTGTVVNCTSGVNVRSGPSTSYSKLGTAPKGTTYTVTGKSGSWYKILYDGKTGYVYSTYLSVSSTQTPEPQPSETETGTVVNCTSGVNVRSGPSTSYSKLGTAPKGTTYTVTGKSGSWYKILYDGKTGYVYSTYLSVSSTQTPEPQPSETETGTVVNCTSGVNVRSGPSTSYSKLGIAPKGTTYTVTGRSGSWYKILYDGKTGYVYSTYLSVSSTQTPEPQPSETETGTVVNCTSGVNVRSGPSTSYSKLGIAPKGTTYTVTGKSGSWYKILYDGKTGYVYSTYLSVSSTQTPEPQPSETETGTVVNCTSGVNVRSGPSTSYSKLGTAPKGTTYTVTGKSGSWYKILYDGKTGYVYSTYLSVSST